MEKRKLNSKSGTFSFLSEVSNSFITKVELKKVAPGRLVSIVYLCFSPG